MSATQAFSGSAVVDTEYSLTGAAGAAAAQTDPGVYQVVLDCSSMAGGDAFELRCYEKVRAGGPQRLCVVHRMDGSQAPAVASFTPALQLMHGWDYRLARVAGTPRSFDWSVRKVG